MSDPVGKILFERQNPGGLHTVHITREGNLPNLDTWCRIKEIEPDELERWHSWLDENGIYHLYLAWRPQS